MKHPNNVSGISAKELAGKFMKTIYSYQLTFFTELLRLYKEEAIKEERYNHPVLHKLLSTITTMIYNICTILERVCKICKPKMKNQISGISAKDLAREFMRTIYSYQLTFFTELLRLYEEEAIKEDSYNHPELNKLLSAIATMMYNICITLERVWKICKPKMGNQ